MKNTIDEILSEWRHKRTYPVIEKIIKKHNIKSFIEIGLGTPGLSTSILYNFYDVNVIGIDTKDHKIYHELEKLFVGRFKFIQGKSVDILNQINDKSIDMIYVDGSHIYENVLSDLELSLKKIKDDGIVSGHDYGNKKWYDVKKAVDETVLKYNLKLHKEDYLNYYLTIRKQF